MDLVVGALPSRRDDGSPGGERYLDPPRDVQSMIVNGTFHELDACTVMALLDFLKIEPRGVAVAVDGEVVPRSTWHDVSISGGAVVEILTAAAGG